MKKILSNIYLLAALFMIGAAITSCSKSDDTPTPEPKPVGPTTYTMTIKATKSADAKTRALIPVTDGQGNVTSINAEWAAGEKVYVYNVTKGVDLVGYLEAKTAGESTTLRGTLTGTIEDGDKLTLKFLSPSYSSQNGTLEYIAAHCDYATASVSVTDASTPSVTTTDASFINEQAIVKFTLLDKADGTTTLSPNDLTINYGSGSVKLTNIPATTYTTNGAGILYVAIPGFNHDVTLNAKMEDKFYSDTYSYTRGGATFENNKYYAITVKMVKNFNPYKTPLTLECCAGTNKGASIWVDNYGDLEYTVNNGTTWIPWSNISNTLDITNEQTVSFRRTTWTSGLKIHCNGDCYIYGNIMSLLDPTNFATKTDLTDDDTFKELFKDNANITHRNGYDLVLPATTLTTQCYSSMFFGCTKLNHIKCLATDISATSCTSNWVFDAGNYLTEGTKTFVIASGTKEAWQAKEEYWGIPSGWTVIEE